MTVQASDSVDTLSPISLYCTLTKKEPNGSHLEIKTKPKSKGACQIRLHWKAKWVFYQTESELCCLHSQPFSIQCSPQIDRHFKHPFLSNWHQEHKTNQGPDHRGLSLKAEKSSAARGAQDFTVVAGALEQKQVGQAQIPM